jgi:hypothetical protein
VEGYEMLWGPDLICWTRPWLCTKNQQTKRYINEMIGHV